MPMTDSFERFRQQLSQQVRHAQQMGATRQDLVTGAEHIGDWLAREVDPKNPEQRLLKELWAVSSQEEQRALASALVKMAERTPVG
jgi:nuclear transport factor 2 (NTF2) superfamily protein